LSCSPVRCVDRRPAGDRHRAGVAGGVDGPEPERDQVAGADGLVRISGGIDRSTAGRCLSADVLAHAAAASPVRHVRHQDRRQLLAGVSCNYGFEACGDLAEEVSDPSRRIPKAMRMTIYVGGAAAMFTCLALILATPNI